MDILEKIRPLHINQIAGSKVSIKKIHEYLNKPCSVILCLIGPTGCGKTLICECLFRQHEVLEINKEMLTGFETTRLIGNFMRNRSITSFFENRKKKIVFFDSIDILLATERTVMSIVQDALQLAKQYDAYVLATCKINEDKKLLDLKKNIEFVRISNPTVKDAFTYLMNTFDSKGIQYKSESLLRIAHTFCGNIRDIVLSFYETETETDLRVENAFKHMSTFEIVNSFLRKPHDVAEIEYLLNDDVSVLSLILYENLPDELYTNRNFRASTCLLDSYVQLNKYYAASCDIEEYNNMDASASVNTSDYVSRIRVFAVYNMLCQLPHKVRAKDNALRDSQILSRISHKNIFSHKIKGIQNNNMGISYLELLYIVDSIVKKKNIKLLKANKALSSDEINLVNTYAKYFLR